MSASPETRLAHSPMHDGGAAENAVFSFELHLVNTPDGSQRVFAQEIETTCR